MTRRFGSVCSGVECASLAFAPFGWEAAWVAEVDIAASAVLAHRFGATQPRYVPPFPDTPTGEKERQAYLRSRARKIEWGDRVTNWGNMTVLPELVRNGMAEAPEMLCGGTPCQSWSVAGLRKGLRDPRGGLTLSFVELADAIDDVRRERGDHPCVVVWANVPGVLSDKGNGFGCFLAALAGEDVPLEPPGGKWSNAGVVLGPKRAVAWRVGDAQYFGVAQRRNRVYVVASARSGFDPAAVSFEFDGVRRDTPPSRETGPDTAVSTARGAVEGGGAAGRDGQPDAGGLDGGRGRLGGPDVVATPEAFGGNNTRGPIQVAPACNAHGGGSRRMDFESEAFVVMSTGQAGAEIAEGGVSDFDL